MVKHSRLGGNFWRLLVSAGFSNLADGIIKMAVPLIAVRYTDSPMVLGGLGLALTLPWLVLALPAGAWADRLDRRRVMVAANAFRALIAAALTVVFVSGLGSIAVLYAAALLAGCAEVLHDTSAQSILPQVVKRDHLTRANSRLMGVEMLTNQFAGPPLGGWLIGIAGAGVALALGTPAALWAFAVMALASLRGSFTPERTEPSASVVHDIAAGMRYLVRHSVLRTLALMTGVSNIGFTMWGTVFVLYAVGPASPMGLTEAQYGVMMSTLAVGAMVGSVLASPMAGQLGRQGSLAFAIVAMTIPLVVVAVSTNPWVFGATWFVSGVGLMVWNVVAVSLRQQVTPDPMLGRMNGCYRLISWGLQPLGALLGGAIGQALGLRAVFWIAAGLSSVVALGLMIVTNPTIAQAEAAIHEP